MPANTSRGYTYPLYADTQSFPAQIQDLAQDIDADVQGAYNDVAEAYNAPSAKITQVGQVIPSNVSTTLTFANEIYDNDGMVDLGVNNTRIQIQSPGIYVITAWANLTGNGNATLSGAALLISSSGGIVSTAAVSSKRLDNDKATIITATAIHYTAAAGDNITCSIRHNNPASITVSTHELMATRMVI